ncbi:unnamed protein product, partial [Musa textilis]
MTTSNLPPGFILLLGSMHLHEKKHALLQRCDSWPGTVSLSR